MEQLNIVQIFQFLVLALEKCRLSSVLRGINNTDNKHPDGLVLETDQRGH
ncbi:MULTISPECIES: hypothetical protein [unclassified Pseudomonas]